MISTLYFKHLRINLSDLKQKNKQKIMRELTKYQIAFSELLSRQEKAKGSKETKTGNSKQFLT